MTQPPPVSEAKPFPAQGRLLGLDYGTRRIGLALSNPERTIASPLENYTRQGEAQDLKRLSKVAVDYCVTGVVVGLPVHMSGDEGEKAKEARAFGEWVARGIGLPVTYWDERYTTAVAEEHLRAAELSKKKRKARLDMLAAQIMLQSYLESLRGAG